MSGRLLAIVMLSVLLAPLAMAREKPLFYRSASELYTGNCKDLAIAAASGRTARIQKIVSSGTDANCRGYSGVTPLYWAIAVRHPNRDGIKALLSAGADPSLPLTQDGDTAMHYAAMRRDSIALRVLLELGADPNTLNPVQEKTPIFDAANAENAGVLISAGAKSDVLALWFIGMSPPPEVPRERWSALQTAAFRTDYQTVMVLLNAGADWRAGAHGGLLGVIEDMRSARSKGVGLDPSSDQFAWLQRVIAWLNLHGESIPPMP